MIAGLRDAYTDLVKLAGNGTIPAFIPAHYVRYAYGLHCQARGRLRPSIGWQDSATLSRTIRLP
jgi:hypothetical protein